MAPLGARAVGRTSARSCARETSQGAPREDCAQRERAAPGMQTPDPAEAEQAADDANVARQDSTDDNPSNGQDAPVSTENPDGD